MPDDKTQTGKPDRDRVSANEPYEVDYLADKFKLPSLSSSNVIQQERGRCASTSRPTSTR